MTVTCQYCNQPAKLVTGEVIYPHRPDLGNKFFWSCTKCDAYVGCHPTGNGKKPLGLLANAQLRTMKSQVHATIDPYWKDGKMSRTEMYRRLAILMNIPNDQCHVGMFTLKLCSKALRAAKFLTSSEFDT